MKHLLLTTIAAVVLVGCGASVHILVDAWINLPFDPLNYYFTYPQ